MYILSKRTLMPNNSSTGRFGHLYSLPGKLLLDKVPWTQSCQPGWLQTNIMSIHMATSPDPSDLLFSGEKKKKTIIWVDIPIHHYYLQFFQNAQITIYIGKPLPKQRFFYFVCIQRRNLIYPNTMPGI